MSESVQDPVPYRCHRGQAYLEGDIYTRYLLTSSVRSSTYRSKLNKRVFTIHGTLNSLSSSIVELEYYLHEEDSHRY